MFCPNVASHTEMMGELLYALLLLFRHIYHINIEFEELVFRQGESNAYLSDIRQNR